MEQHPEVVQEHLDKEEESGRVFKVGKSEQAEVLGVHCIPLGLSRRKARLGGGT